MTDKENRALYIAEQCRRAGMTMAGCAGVLANIDAESGFISINVQDVFNKSLNVTDEEFTRRVDAGDVVLFMTPDLGYGLAQWTATDRKRNMLAFHQQRGVSIGDFRTQVDFLIQEMPSYKYAWRSCTTEDDPYQCGYAVCRYYEIPSNAEKQAKYRGGLAQTWYSWLKENGGQESTISEEPERPAVDEDGIAIPQTWPPRTIDRAHCAGWPEIRLLQTLLVMHGYNVLMDGIFSDTLEDKLKEWQVNHGLKADGVCGKNTWISLGIDKSIF